MSKYFNLHPKARLRAPASRTQAMPPQAPAPSTKSQEPDISVPGVPQTIPADTAAHLLKFLQEATPVEIEALLSSAHAFLQAGVAQNSLAQSKQILARDGRLGRTRWRRS